MDYGDVLFFSIGDSYSPSMESLVDDGNADDEYEDDPELNVKGHESETWSETIDKKVLKGYKEKTVKRQDNIWGKCWFSLIICIVISVAVMSILILSVLLLCEAFRRQPLLKLFVLTYGYLSCHALVTKYLLTFCRIYSHRTSISN